MLPTHKHACLECRLIWEHSNAFRGVKWAHRCPACGDRCSLHYFEAAKVNVCHIAPPADAGTTTNDRSA